MTTTKLEEDLVLARRVRPGGPSAARAVVLVEGISDRLALEALAARWGADLAAEGVAIVPIGGANNIGTFLGLFVDAAPPVRLAGLCDAAERGDFARALERAGSGSDLTTAEMEELGFHVCVEDLEGELIRALGTTATLELIEARGLSRSFRIFQQQPAWRGRALQEQLRRFLGERWKVRAPERLLAALDLDRVPRPLDRVLHHALA